MDQLLNLQKYTALELTIFLAGCFMWVVVYAIYLRIMLREKRAMMPFFAAVSNLAWEFQELVHNDFCEIGRAHV